jgi:2-polyprenyl-6-methoxyphenol hydroxylase-like FAD-dependent oxidoreductase
MTTNTTAIIIGSSLAGLCCARVLSPRYQTVIVIDRDELTSGNGARAGVPHGRHAHVILDRGRRELERCFPGFERRMVERGACLVDPGLEFATLGNTGWIPRVPTDARMVCASRELTDATIRALAGTLPNVTTRARTEVKALRLSGRRVVGVELQARDGGAAEDLRADLVVDASGRSSRLPALLEQAGVTPPDETVIDSGTWYSTRWFQARPGHALPEACWWKAVILTPTLAGPGALLTPIEGDRWIVSIASVGTGQPDIDDASYMAALQRLPSPIIAEAVGEPLSPVYGYRATVNRMRHLDRWTDPVAGLVVVGDAACALNPIHGQGVTCTAVCAQLFEAAVAKEGIASPTLALRYHQAQAHWMREPWGLATSFDLKFPGTVGKRSFAPKLLAPFMKLFAEAVRNDASLLRRVVDSGQLNRPFAEVLTPGVVAQVLGGAVQRRLTGKRPPAAPATAYPPHTITA